MLKQHVYEEHILRNYLGVLVFPGLSILGFLDQPEVGENDPHGRVVPSIEDSDYIPTRASRPARHASSRTGRRHGPFYRRIVITGDHEQQPDAENNDGVPGDEEQIVKDEEEEEEEEEEDRLAVKEERKVKSEQPADVKMEAHAEVKTEGSAMRSAVSQVKVKLERAQSAGPGRR
ncbi:unnamed protein product [Zymoseptoria tritici ST99CH_3D1]|uniref:Uncharacterized protein n=2 Tax=Zymoseptoria tritici TaxID=1047171 RepID=A0A1X7RHG9_ZYMT9|nr:unnamed protein product [Zymoseptoria tritici ST99CH_3D7]SMR43232.1 unnamed protein product [Zymoseptoria tritici ST99CH_1E4]SMR45393.1 unnamed protein product [Zymoseptoria tritici ST99CH_3D1]